MVELVGINLEPSMESLVKNVGARHFPLHFKVLETGVSTGGKDNLRPPGDRPENRKRGQRLFLQPASAVVANWSK
jgi:hypothetical protein